ncbi:MAG: outer membrane protein assembly factor BamE [Burkholderiales bacterium]|nr:outer membrane protein assembly factor BamE [Burkholderiales bacterium]
MHVAGRQARYHLAHMKKPLISMTFAALLVQGCGNIPILPFLKPYKIDIQQGNYVTQDMLAKLQPGMTRSQVRFALGTPLIVDPFRTDRWDYAYTFAKAGVLTEQRTVTVVFRGDVLDRIEGDVVAGANISQSPAAGNAPAPANAATPAAPAAAPAAPEKK